MLSAIVIASILSLISAHGRWKCPTPRDALDVNGNHIVSDNTGNKYAACGPQSGNWGFGNVTTLQPGWNTLTYEESISHAGSPFRIALLDDKEVARIVLLDHIPHNDASSPIFGTEKTYQPYRISVNIPDVACSKCSLQLLYVMTDKTTKCGSETCYYNPNDAACKGSTDANAATCAGAPNDQVCLATDECFSNYHSCTDVVIQGSQPLASFTNIDGQPADWLFKTKKMSYYTTEVGSWTKEGWLAVAGLAANYTTDFKTLTC